MNTIHYTPLKKKNVLMKKKLIKSLFQEPPIFKNA